MNEDVEIRRGLRIPRSEISFAFARSGGPGGQHVNKVSTRVDLLFNPGASRALSEGQKDILRARLGGRLDRDGVLRVRSEASRSQWANREEAVRKFSALLARALRTPARRIPSNPTHASRERRLESKRRAGAVKRARRGKFGDGDAS